MAIRDDPVWFIEFRRRRRSAIAGKPRSPVPAMVEMTWRSCVDPANPMIERIGKDQVAIGIEREIERIVQLRPIAGPPSPARPCCPVPATVLMIQCVLCVPPIPPPRSPGGIHGCRSRPVKRKVPPYKVSRRM